MGLRVADKLLVSSKLLVIVNEFDENLRVYSGVIRIAFVSK